MRYRIKGAFLTRTGKEFVRYWRNSRNVTGWLPQNLRDLADTFTARQCARFTANRPANAAGRYSFEPVR
jgi:hypothetical protein